MSFLKAEWKKLALANYEIDQAVLSGLVPHGTELDLWQGKCFVSLVGFMFQNTKLLGFKIPFHINFEEVNLRFYVKRPVEGGFRRGVVFIKEMVPKRAITFVANNLYNEKYSTLPMKHEWIESDKSIDVKYSWKINSRWQSFRIKGHKPPIEIEIGSETEFITEHYYGYAKLNDHVTNEYEVKHPRWLKYEVEDFHVDVDFGQVYGEAFDFLNSQPPFSVMLAEGSAISVEHKKLLKEETSPKNH